MIQALLTSIFSKFLAFHSQQRLICFTPKIQHPLTKLVVYHLFHLSQEIQSYLDSK